MHISSRMHDNKSMHACTLRTMRLNSELKTQENNNKMLRITLRAKMYPLPPLVCESGKYWGHPFLLTKYFWHASHAYKYASCCRRIDVYSVVTFLIAFARPTNRSRIAKTWVGGRREKEMAILFYHNSLVGNRMFGIRPKQTWGNILTKCW